MSTRRRTPPKQMRGDLHAISSSCRRSEKLSPKLSVTVACILVCGHKTRCGYNRSPSQSSLHRSHAFKTKSMRQEPVSSQFLRGLNLPEFWANSWWGRAIWGRIVSWFLSSLFCFQRPADSVSKRMWETGNSLFESPAEVAALRKQRKGDRHVIMGHSHVPPAVIEQQQLFVDDASRLAYGTELAVSMKCLSAIATQ